ncbi:MAG: winged helix-turn-helix transcriptional regulator [Opitutales bacterium]|nr:winged helix-turn-helix transcriptional regulator [Opitutales bacterium]
MKSIQVYQCFCDETRLRILNLLLVGPMCVCHFSEVLGVPQPKVSRHLKALREAGALESKRCYNWTICSLPEAPSALLEVNLKCLQDLRSEEPVFKKDLKKREALMGRLLNQAEELPGQMRCLIEGC